MHIRLSVPRRSQQVPEVSLYKSVDRVHPMETLPLFKAVFGQPSPGLLHENRPQYNMVPQTGSQTLELHREQFIVGLAKGSVVLSGSKTDDSPQPGSERGVHLWVGTKVTSPWLDCTQFILISKSRMHSWGQGLVVQSPIFDSNYFYLFVVCWETIQEKPAGITQGQSWWL